MILIPSLLSPEEFSNDIHFCMVMGDEKLCEAILNHDHDAYQSWQEQTRTYES